jgi:hypothetical protein
MSNLMEIITLHAYDGPNIFSPQPSVLLRVRCPSDRSREIQCALKEHAQRAGILLAYLDTAVIQQAEHFIIDATFVTPFPSVGAKLAAFVVENLQEQDDTERDIETPLFELFQDVRQQTPSTPALQLIAEARIRNLPVVKRRDGLIQFGYGKRSWTFNLSSLDMDGPLHPPWEHIAALPIIAVTGEELRCASVQHIVAYLEQAGLPVSSQNDADFDTILSLLSNTSVEYLVVGLSTTDIARRGLPFDRCTVSILTDMDGECPCPSDVLDVDEWSKVLGLPMLVSDSSIVVNTAFPALGRLASYAPNKVRPLAELDDVLRSLTVSSC